MSMVNEKQPFVLRCAVLYCFQSFLYKNEVGQSQIIQTLLPSTAEGWTPLFIISRILHLCWCLIFCVQCFSEHGNIRAASVQWSLQQRPSCHVVGRHCTPPFHRGQQHAEGTAPTCTARHVSRQPSRVAPATVYQHTRKGGERVVVLYSIHAHCMFMF